MLSDEVIARIGDALDAMPAKASRSELVLLLTQIETKIRAAQERGATYVEIAEQITASGYPVEANQLRPALYRLRRTVSGGKGTKRRGSRKRAHTSAGGTASELSRTRLVDTK